MDFLDAHTAMGLVILVMALALLAYQKLKRHYKRDKR